MILDKDYINLNLNRFVCSSTYTYTYFILGFYLLEKKIFFFGILYLFYLLMIKEKKNFFFFLANLLFITNHLYKISKYPIKFEKKN